MTREQETELKKARDRITEARNILDDVMYRMTPITEDEHLKLRRAYDLLCEANDKL